VSCVVDNTLGFILGGEFRLDFVVSDIDVVIAGGLTPWDFAVGVAPGILP
ncbi:18127_t:CDS:2, partial [Gigaspora rosea]